MRILYITNSFPYPLTSGYLRHYHLIRELSRRHAVTLLSLTNAGFREEHAQALAPYTERILLFPRMAHGKSPCGKALRRARTFMGCEPAMRDMRRAIEELVDSKRFDVALLSGKQTLPAARALRGMPLVIDVCDAVSARILGHLSRAELRQAPRLFGSYLRMKSIERSLMRSASYLVFASCRDRDSLCQDPTQCAAVVPNGVDLDYWRRSSAAPDTGKIVFTGAMHYPPNADAAQYLIREILPRVRTAVPDAECSIVGRDPQPRILAAAEGQEGVHVTGYVDDVRPYLDRATVFAAPLRFGAGIQNKVLEAMAMEVPIIASPIAAAGLRTVDGRTPPIEVAEETDAFAQAIIRKLRCAAPSAVARRYVQQHFRWPEAAGKLECILSRAVTRHAKRRVRGSSSVVAFGEPVAAGELPV
ncbi:MAG: glycosyltransferase [Pirellulaceae bacterium]